VKIRFYIDFWESGAAFQLKNGLIAQTQPPAKNQNTRRVAFDVYIPDEFLFEIDLISPEVSPTIEVLK
jgi:hypothetical protein